MKHIKIFEDFFKYYRADEITDTKGIWGYTREEIEDLFIHFVDDLGLSVSVNFTIYFKTGSYSYSVKDSEIPEYLKGIESGDLIPGIQVNMFVNSNIFWKAGVDGKGGVFYTSDGSERSRKYLDYLEKISGEIESLMTTTLRRIRGYEIETKNLIKSGLKVNKYGPDFSNKTSIHPDSGTEYGDIIYSVLFKKR